MVKGEGEREGYERGNKGWRKRKREREREREKERERKRKKEKERERERKKETSGQEGILPNSFAVHLPLCFVNKSKK